MRVGPDEGLRGLVEGLRSRRQEIEQTVLIRVNAIDAPGGNADPEYLDGLRMAIVSAVDDTIDAAEANQSLAVPQPVLSQAAFAARLHIPLETMLRRYLAGHTVVGDFTMDEAERQDVAPEVLRRVLRSQLGKTDRAVAAISAAYAQEERSARLPSARVRRANQVRRLLAGELLDTADLAYDFDAWHLGIVAAGHDAADAVARLTDPLGLRRLIVRDERSVWAWLGGRRRVDAGLLGERLLPDSWPRSVVVGVGEPAFGITGWRLTHRQAQAALSVSRARGDAVTRYADAALLASTLQDDLLATSLRLLYLDPLRTDKDDGAISRETLRAYFDAQQNVSAAAATLGVNRNTVASRLRTIEDRIGRSLDSCGTELLAALRLDEIGESYLAR